MGQMQAQALRSVHSLLQAMAGRWMTEGARLLRRIVKHLARACVSFSSSSEHSCLLTRTARLLRPLQHAMARGAFAASAPSTIALSAASESAVNPSDLASSTLQPPHASQLLQTTSTNVGLRFGRTYMVTAAVWYCAALQCRGSGPRGRAMASLVFKATRQILPECTAVAQP